MTSILALSVTGKIEQYGAYAGFAAVLGLAVLSLLYFAQAREVKRLREWAGRAPERAADLQDRVQSAAQQRVVAQPQQPRPVGPAPTAGPAGPAARPAAATPAGQAQGAPGAAPATAAAAVAAAGAAGTATATPGAGQPTTVQPAGNGAGVPQPRPGQPLRVPPSAATPPPARGGGPAVPEPEQRARSIWAILGAAAALIVVGLVVVFVVIGVGGGSGTPSVNTIGTPGQSASTTAAGGSKTTKGSTPTAAPKPGTYTVAVLNGTAVPGLARGVANRLQNTKFKIGNVTNAADQSRSATLVEYAPGHLSEAQAVAKAIDVGKDAIQAVDPGSRAIAGEQASVVVIVGSDQNTSPQTTP